MSLRLSIQAAAFLKDTRLAGPGLRDALWVQGCTIGCPGCANHAYLPLAARVVLPVERLLAHFAARRGRIDGLTVSGGEPTEQPEAVAALLRGVHALGLSTVVFSGRTYENLSRDPTYAELLAYTDLLIDGPYLQRQRDLSLSWRGSRNQRLLRLSQRFREEDLTPPQANGEIVIGERGAVLHGIGALRVVEARPESVQERARRTDLADVGLQNQPSIEGRRGLLRTEDTD